MKLKLAAIALIVSVALSCDTSFGCDLLDKMLGRAGCSSCQAPKAPSCGCGGGGLMDKIMSRSAGCGCGGGDMLTYDANMDCGPVASPCGCEAAPAADCGCSAPAAPCGGGGGCGLFSKFRGGGGGGCGCEAAAAPVADCGCAEPAPAPVADCGCSAPAPACGGCEAAAAPVADCGCAAPAPAPAPVADCGCSAPAAAPGCGGGGCGLFSKLFSKKGGNGCGCEAAAPVADCGCAAPAPVADCGCSAPAPAAPVADCGCSAPAAAPACGGGGGFGLFSKIGGGGCGCSAAAPAAAVADCGCSSPAPVVASCGCNAPVSEGCDSTPEECGVRGKLSLLDRLRGNRIPRTKEGVVIGSCNDGCNSPCPAQPAAECGCGAPMEAAPCTSCGQGEIIYGDAQQYDGGCSTCQGGSTEGEIIYGDAGAVAAPVMMDTEGVTNVDPVVPSNDANSTEGVIESGDASGAVEDAVDAVEDAVEGASPVVDPGAFVPSRRTTVGS